LTTKDSEASAGQSPLPPPGPFVTPITSAKSSGIQPKFASIVKKEYKINRKEENEKKEEEKEKDVKMEENENNNEDLAKEGNEEEKIEENGA
uniref:Uncharacterized protein n=1 Tax=Meloidogyne floridensis TaxID=298350 RepID=A0A915NRQ6_9BILA